MTTATKSARKPARTVSVRWNAKPLDTSVIAVTVKDGKKSDDYHLTHADDSCEVEWTHDDDAGRTYTVTCSAYDGRPTHCTCPARVPCRHKSATAVLAKRGHIKLPTLAGIVPSEYEYDFREDATDGRALAVAVK